MIYGRDSIKSVSEYLLDQEEHYEFTGWSEELLLRFFRYAVGIVASTDKAKFMRRTEIALKPGRVQDLPDSCVEVNDVYGLLGEDGDIMDFVRKTDLKWLSIMKRPVCRVNSEGPYRLDSYQYDPSNPNVIFVDPPVPRGESATLVISCFHPPEVTNAEEGVELPSTAEPIIFELMLYYAYGVDTESVPSRDRSNTHWQNAMTLMGLDSNTSANRFAYTRVPEARVRNG